MKRPNLVLFVLAGTVLVAYLANELPINAHGRAVWTLRLGSPTSRRASLDSLKALNDDQSTVIVTRVLGSDKSPCSGRSRRQS